jgi:hypothetical protein
VRRIFTRKIWNDEPIIVVVHVGGNPLIDLWSVEVALVAKASAEAQSALFERQMDHATMSGKRDRAADLRYLVEDYALEAEAIHRAIYDRTPEERL